MRLAHVACCLEYPGEDTRLGARLAAGRFDADLPEMAAALRALADWLDATDLAEAQERYSSLFDLNPSCTLGVSYHLWGDTYPRGAFLAAMAAELRAARLDPGTELPDHLPTLLRLLERINDLEDLRLLVQAVLLPALERMGESIASCDLPWCDMLRALPKVLAGAGVASASPRPTLHVLQAPAPMPSCGGCSRA